MPTGLRPSVSPCSADGGLGEPGYEDSQHRAREQPGPETPASVPVGLTRDLGGGHVSWAHTQSKAAALGWEEPTP